jgi:hypothetical protein
VINDVRKSNLGFDISFFNEGTAKVRDRLVDRGEPHRTLGAAERQPRVAWHVDARLSGLNAAVFAPGSRANKALTMNTSSRSIPHAGARILNAIRAFPFHHFPVRLDMVHCKETPAHRRQSLAQHGGIQPVILHAFAAFIPFPGLHPVILDAGFLQPARQVEPKHTRLMTGHHFTGKLLVFNHKKHERVVRHFLHALRRHPVELTAYPVMFAAGVDAGFERFAGDS